MDHAMKPTPTIPIRAALDLNDEILNRAEAAAFIDVNTRTLDDWHGRGEGPPVCILGGSRRYLKSSLLAWAKSQETSPAHARRVRPGNPRKQSDALNVQSAGEATTTP